MVPNLKRKQNMDCFHLHVQDGCQWMWVTQVMRGGIGSLLSNVYYVSNNNHKYDMRTNTTIPMVCVFTLYVHLSCTLSFIEVPLYKTCWEIINVFQPPHHWHL